MPRQEQYLSSLLPENNTAFSKTNISKLLKALHEMDCEWFHTEEQVVPDMTLRIWGGVFFVNGVYHSIGINSNDETVAIDSPTFTVPTTNDRVDLLYWDVQAEVFAVTIGTESVSPVRPAIADLIEQIPVAFIYHRPASVMILNDDDSTNSYIISRNIRPVVSVGGGSKSTYFGFTLSGDRLVVESSLNNQNQMVDSAYIDSFIGGSDTTISIDLLGHLTLTFE